jgi:hypothetical protein
MSRRIPITNVVQSGGSPGYFVLGPVTPDNTSGNWTGVFKGKFYRQKTTPFTIQPFYDYPLATPPGYDLIAATQFDVVDNATYAGRYTVYTQVSSIDTPPSTFSGGFTEVRVNETVGSPLSPGDVSAGFVTNVSTYYIYRTGSEGSFVVPPGVSIYQDGLEFPGRTFSGWGEVFNQNMEFLLQNFASGTQPADPVVGMLWYDLGTGLLKIWDGVSFAVINSAAFAPASSAKVAGTGATWQINHNLNASSPFIVMCQFYVDVGAGVHKLIIPSDVTFVNANRLDVTFSAPYTGFALVRL